MQKILLVEDDDEMRECVAGFLRGAGYLVEEAENGKVALERLAGDEPYLVLLDLRMPIMSGPELLETLRQQNRLASLAVVAVSGAGLPTEAPEVDRFLRKPLVPHHLLSTVGEFCEPADPRSWVS